MKKDYLFILLGLLLYSVPMSADVQFKVLLADGSEISIPFAKHPQVFYPDCKTMLISSDSGALQYEFSEISSFSYSDNPTAIKKVFAELGEGKATISGIKAGEVVNLYNVSGQILGTVKVADNGIAVINTSSIKESLIIVKTPTASFKIKK